MTPALRGFFVTGTGTSVGKTLVARGLARALVRAGHAVAALKPVETGCTPDPKDALALARACGRPELAHAPGLLRAHAPLSPYAATLTDGITVPSVPELAAAVRAAREGATLVVEGAGGLLVPLDARATLADLAVLLALPLVVVAPDELGVLSWTETLAESAERRGLVIACVVLSRRTEEITKNREILAERLRVPVVELGPIAADDDDALADAIEGAGILGVLALLAD